MSLLRCVGGSMQEADSKHVPRGCAVQTHFAEDALGLGLQNPGDRFFF